MKMSSIGQVVSEMFENVDGRADYIRTDDGVIGNIIAKVS